MVLEEPDLALPAAGEPASPKKKEVAASQAWAISKKKRSRFPGPGALKKKRSRLLRPAALKKRGRGPPPACLSGIGHDLFFI